jgi:hypothetical protein|tara:strand:+ start:103 stop:606 length:504 start_codon:yes stop_codon:yes gene_type:complete
MRKRLQMRYELLAFATTLFLAGCGGETASEGAENAQSDGETIAEIAPVETATLVEQSVTSAEMAIMAREGLGTGSEWVLPGPVKITGPMAEIILDAPPDVYLSFGNDALDVDVFAIMSEEFAEKLEYNRDDFFNAQGQPTVRCTGKATFPQPDAPPVISDCEPVFGE